VKNKREIRRRFGNVLQQTPLLIVPYLRSRSGFTGTVHQSVRKRPINATNLEAHLMKASTLFLSLALAAAQSELMAQATDSHSNLVNQDAALDAMGSPPPSAILTANAPSSRMVSRIGIGGGISPLGINLQVATNINAHFNLRGTGNIFKYSNTFNTNGLNLNAKLNLESAGAALDIYPFRAGFRISPGVLFYNGNQVTASDAVAGGTSFTLNGQTFYSATANTATGATPVFGNAALGLNATKPAFTITTGWGNMIPRKEGHWSVPFEIGVALTGAPSLTANLGGWACYDKAQTECTNLASTTNPIAISVQSDLQAQLATWRTDLNPLKTYPIVSIGVAYAFHIR
jgi:hypothetical protein